MFSVEQFRKEFKMKRFLAFALFLGCSPFVRAWNPSDGALIFTPDTRTLSISILAATPTQILTRDSYVARTWIVNSSTCAVFLSSSATSGSLSTNFQIAGSSTSLTPTVFTPDGVNTPWWGPMWAFSNCGAQPTLSIFRTK